jgi:hypothetical protein
MAYMGYSCGVWSVLRAPGNQRLILVNLQPAAIS